MTPDQSEDKAAVSDSTSLRPTQKLPFLDYAGLMAHPSMPECREAILVTGGSAAAAYSCLTTSTEISTAGTVPRFSSQWTVFRSSGQPTPGP